MNPIPIERRLQLDQRAAIQTKLDAGFQIESRHPMIMVKGVQRIRYDGKYFKDGRV